MTNSSRLSGALATWVAALLACVCIPGVGCDGPPPPAPAAPANEPAPPTPEKRFAAFLEAFTRQLNNDQIRGNAAVMTRGDDPNGPTAQWKTEVTHEVLPPSADGAPRRAKLRVTTTSKVTVVIKRKSVDDEEGEEEDSERSDADRDGQTAPRSSTKTVPLVADSPMKTLPSEQVSDYDFEFRDGRWVLLTEIDREKEPFTAVTMDYALNRQ
jgi:hypothetical protein